MADWSKLKRLAEAAAEIDSWYEERDFHAGGFSEMELDIVRSSDRDFIIATNPAAILALIAENERLQAERDQFSAEAQQLDDFSETLGLEIAEAGKREIAHRAERDQLRAESERLQNLACAVNSAMHAAGMPVDADPAELAEVIHRLQIQVATMGKGGRADG